MLEGRVGPTATLLRDGRVLIAGGFDVPGGVGTQSVSLASAELYDPTTGTFSATGSMTVARSNHTATLLTDGRVLITGGQGSTEGPDGTFNLSTAELYDPATGRFTPTGSMIWPGWYRCATLLADGRVLIVGGGESGTKPAPTPTPAALSSLPVGVVYEPGASAELYDPKTGAFSATGSMADWRPAAMAGAR